MKLKIVAAAVGCLSCSGNLSGAVTASFDETRTRASFAFDAADRERNLFVAYGSRDGGQDTNAWEHVALVGTVPQGGTSLENVALPADFPAVGLVARAFLPVGSLSSQDYVQDGLLLQYDAIENAGRGRHDDAPTNWVDLVGNRDMPLVAGDVVGKDYVYVTPQAHKTTSMFPVDFTMTMEAGFAVAEATGTAEMRAIAYVPLTGGMFLEGRTSHPAFEFIATGGYRWLDNPYGNLQRFAASGKYAYCSLRTANYGYNSSDSSFATIDGVGRSRALADAHGGMGGDPVLMIGSTDTCVKYRAVRIYDRTLTDAELARNYAIDQARFEGKVVDSVFETSSVFYAPVDFAITKVKKAKDGSPMVVSIQFGGCDYSRRLYMGWASKDRGEGFGSWENLQPLATASAGTTSLDVIVPDEIVAMLKDMTYRFFLERRPDSSDYAQDGLFLQYDAIENAGRGRHDDAPANWVDLAGGRNLPLVTEGDEVDEVGSDYVHLCALLHETEALGSASFPMTMETGFAVTEYGRVKAECLICSYVPAVGGICCESRSNLSAFQFHSGRYTRWLSSGYANLAAFVAGGKYAYCAMRTANFGSYNDMTTAFATIDGVGRARNAADWDDKSVNPVYALRMGNVDSRMKYRSVRIYSRTLTDAELARNYAIDQARFENKTSETLLAAAATKPERFTPGMYILLR